MLCRSAASCHGRLEGEAACPRTPQPQLAAADPTGKAWPYGIQYAYLREVLATWRTSYDWRVQEAALNALPQFTVQIVRART